MTIQRGESLTVYFSMRTRWDYGRTTGQANNITLRLSLDNGTSQQISNTIYERISGVYSVTLTAAQTDAKSIALTGTHSNDPNNDHVIDLIVLYTHELKETRDEVFSNGDKADTLITNTGNIENKVDIIDTNVDTLLVNANDIENKVDIIDTNVDTSLVNLSTIDGKADTLITNTTNIETKVDTANTNINTIDGKVDTANTNINTIDGKADIIDTNVDTLLVNANDIETKVDTANTNINTIDGKVDIVDTNINTIDGKVDIVDTNVDTLLVNANDIENKVDIIDTNVDTSLVNLSTIDGKADTLITNTGNIENKVDIIDTNVDTSLVNLSTIDGKADIIDTNVDTLLVNANDIENKVDIVDTNVDTSLVNLSTIDGKADTLITNTGNIENKVDTANTNINTIDGKADTIDTNVDTSLVNLSTIDGKADTLITNLTRTEGKVDIIDDGVDSIGVHIVDIRNVLPLEGRIAGQQSSTIIENKIDIQPTKLEMETYIDNAKTSINNKVDLVNNNVDTANIKLTTTNTRLTDIINDVTDIHGKLPDGSLKIADKSVVDNNNIKLDDLIASVSNIQNNTSFSGIVNSKITTPPEGSDPKTYKLYALVFDNGGIPADTDTDIVEIIITDNEGNVIIQDNMVSLPDVGAYSYNFEVAHDQTPGPIVVRFTYVLQGESFVQMRSSEIFDIDYSVSLADIKNDTENIVGKIDIIDAEVNHINDTVLDTGGILDEEFQTAIREIHGVTCNSWTRDFDTGTITVKSTEGLPLFQLQPLPGRLGRARLEMES